jgi:hypothetical protein
VRGKGIWCGCGGSLCQEEEEEEEEEEEMRQEGGGGGGAVGEYGHVEVSRALSLYLSMKGRTCCSAAMAMWNVCSCSGINVARSSPICHESKKEDIGTRGGGGEEGKTGRRKESGVRICKCRK